VPQGIGENIGQHQIERRARREIRGGEAGSPDHPHQIPDAIQFGVVAGDLNRSRIDVTRQHFFVQCLRRGDGEHGGARAEVKHVPRAVRLEHMVKQQQAAARGAVMARAEGERRLDLNPELVGRNAGAIMLAVDQETSGRHGDEVVEAGLDPVFGLDRVEGNARGDIGACGIGDDFAEQRLIGRVGEVHRDVPPAIRPFKRGDRGLPLE
jgi:hypothetical protein